jgi:magnesium-transporting ATPase (P-type)
MKSPKIAADAKAWHALAVEEVSQLLGTRLTGLTDTEATERLSRYGLNRLTPQKQRGPVMRFLLQFHNLLIYVLIGAAVVTALLGHWVDTSVIAGVVLINAIIGFVQEGKAERALEAIRNLLSPQATVLCDGKQVMLPAEELVPGDVVVLQSGDKVAADLRLAWGKSLRIDEAMLTGESVPVEKDVAPVAERTALGDRSCMAYAGTLVTYGQGRGLVVATGDATEIGRISAMLKEVETLTTPLLRQLAAFGRWLTLAIIAMAVAAFAFGVLVHGYSMTEMFMASVGLAVAAIPEGLPAIMTITLAIGVQRMAQRHAIIRRLPAVETLGSVTTICSDKTGTLTRNEMTAQTLATAEHLFEVSGVGYDPHGAFSLQGQELALQDHPELLELGRAVLLCNDAEVYREDSGWRLRGDPTEGALMTVAMKAGLDLPFEREAFPRLDVIPFESEHRFMATLHHDHAGHAFVYLKGAPERVLEMCHRERRPGGDFPLDMDHWHQRIGAIASRGQRPLAVARKVMPGDQHLLRFEDVEGELTLLGLFGLTDPPREEAILAVRQCQEAGIWVKMITGDHALTARAIGRSLGIGDGARALTGTELDEIPDEDLRAAALEVDVFARATPEHKLRLVQALQAEGEIVAMTGDGVNDAPALKRADIGIAMGIKGTEVAKEAAEMVLTDDNFASIAHAVEEGRTVYDNLKKAIVFILPTNGGEAFALIAAILFGLTLPITPVQILWVNMITTVTLALALGFEPPESAVMRRPPRDPAAPLLSGFLVWRIAFVSLIILAGTLGLFLWDLAQGVSIDYARTVAVNTLVMYEAFYLLNTRYIAASVLSREGILGNRYVLLAIGLVLGFQLLFTYLGPMQHLFGTEALEAREWGRILLVGATVFVLVELEKAVLAWRVDRRRQERVGGIPA